MRPPIVADEISAVHGIRGSARKRQSTIRTGDLVVDLKTRVISVHDKAVRVTCKEYCIFELLSVHKGAIVTKQMLLDHLYDGVDESSVSRAEMEHGGAGVHPILGKPMRAAIGGGREV